MYITVDIIIKAAALLGAIGGIWAAAYKIIKWLQKQEHQSADIEQLKTEHSADIKAIEDELCLLTYGLLAALDGLKQLGANGAVTEIHDKIEKHLNKQAHDLK